VFFFFKQRLEESDPSRLLENAVLVTMLNIHYMPQGRILIAHPSSRWSQIVVKLHPPLFLTYVISTIINNK